MFKHNYTYGLKQEGHFITRARVTFQPFAGCWVVFESKYGWSNYFGTSTLYSKNKTAETLQSFTKSWFVGLDHEDWPILKKIHDRKMPKNSDVGQYYYDDDCKVQYSASEKDLFYSQNSENLEEYITSKLGWI